MNFSDTVERFKESLAGTDAFKALAKNCFELVKTDRENAGLYFVAGVAARAFVMRYEDQGLSSEFVESSKATMLGMCEKLVSALQSERGDRLLVLGEVAHEYEWVVTAF